MMDSLPLPPFKGEMLEWLKRHAWKVCISVKGYPGFESLSLRRKRQCKCAAVFLFASVYISKGIQGSNPCLSADDGSANALPFFLFTSAYTSKGIQGSNPCLRIYKVA